MTSRSAARPFSLVDRGAPNRYLRRFVGTAPTIRINSQLSQRQIASVGRSSPGSQVSAPPGCARSDDEAVKRDQHVAVVSDIASAQHPEREVRRGRRRRHVSAFEPDCGIKATKQWRATAKQNRDDVYSDLIDQPER